MMFGTSGDDGLVRYASARACQAAKTAVWRGGPKSSPWPLQVTPGAGQTVTVSRIRPGLLYLLEVAP